MRIIVIGDIHGRTIWKDILNNEQYDHVIFIGDYFDKHEKTSAMDQVANFDDIIAFRDSQPDKVTLLLGNHDYHYLDVDETYSGYQPSYRYLIRDSLIPNLSKLQICKKIDDIWFTHAGITQTFLDNLGISGDIEQGLNDLLVYKPLSYKFVRGTGDVYGDHISQGPLWIRIRALLQDKIPGIHVVGHSTTPKIMINDNVYQIDTLGSSKEYLTIENGILIPKKLVLTHTV